MLELPNTAENITLIQDFLDETRKRIHKGVALTFTKKANSELLDLVLDFEIEIDHIEEAIKNLTTENYYRGIDPSGLGDFDVCAFSTKIGKRKTVIYFKFGLEINGLQILLFSNHIPNYSMTLPFKN